jgi:hypothetical protein
MSQFTKVSSSKRKLSSLVLWVFTDRQRKIIVLFFHHILYMYPKDWLIFYPQVICPVVKQYILKQACDGNISSISMCHSLYMMSSRIIEWKSFISHLFSPQDFIWHTFEFKSLSAVSRPWIVLAEEYLF